jgi:hypothetical protein
MDVKEEGILGASISQHWYYSSKARVLRTTVRHLERTSVIDIGAGSGVFSKALLDDGWTDAICVDPAYRVETAESHNGKPISFVRTIERPANGLVLMMDVCEHVDDDIGFIRSYERLALPGTHFFISVPAFQFLFSGHDIFLEHRRRYTLRQLEQRVQGSGLQIVRGAYCFSTIFPFAVAQRLIEKLLIGTGTIGPRSSLRQHSYAVNFGLAALCTCELPFLRHNRAFGLTAFCLARKPSTYNN